MKKLFLLLILLLNSNLYALNNNFWASFQNDAKNSGRSILVGPKNVTLNWELNFPTNLEANQIVIDKKGDVYLNSDDFYKLNSDGNIIWKVPIKSDDNNTPAIGIYGNFYFIGRNNILYSVNASGNIRWKYKFQKNIRSAPVIDNKGIIYLASMDGYLYAFYTDGSIKWKYKIGEGIWSNPVVGKDNTIYIVAMDGYLYAIGEDGISKWHYFTGNKSQSCISVADDGTLFVDTAFNAFVALNPKGEIKWRYELKAGEYIKTPISIFGDGGIVLSINQLPEFATANHKIYKFNNKGEKEWEYLTSKPCTINAISIDVNEDIYFTTGEANLVSLSKKGLLRWKYRVSTKNIDLGVPIIGINHTLYVGADNKKLYKFSQISNIQKQEKVK